MQVANDSDHSEALSPRAESPTRRCHLPKALRKNQWNACPSLFGTQVVVRAIVGCYGARAASKIV